MPALKPGFTRARVRGRCRHYHDQLVANGVENYSYEQCWHDYRFNIWRALISLLAMGPSIESQHKASKGMFAEKPTKGDEQLRTMYDKLNERIIAALIDHDWLNLVLEGARQPHVPSRCLPALCDAISSHSPREVVSAGSTYCGVCTPCARCIPICF
jgi:hypothetical protein